MIVGSLGRIVVGALTDRYGGRVMFPIVSAVTIIPILFIAFFALDSYALLLVGGFFLGIAGTAFAVGVPFVNAWFPPERRGLAIGIFGAGMGGTAISALTTVKLYTNVGEQGAVPDHRRGAGGATPSRPGWSCATPRAASCRRPVPGERGLANARLPITWQACLLYAVAFGGYVAFSVYLPAYLKTAYGLTPADAANRMAGFVVVAVIMRPVGGWLSDKLGAIPVLAAGFGVVVVGAGGRGRHPAAERIGTVAFLAMAAALGSGSGATFALIAKVTDPSRVGGVTGLVGAAGGLGGFVPPLIMGYVYGRTDSYAIGLWLLRATAALALLLTVTVVRRTATQGQEATLTHRREARSGMDGALTDALVRSRRFFTRGTVSRRPADPDQARRPRGRRLLPRPLEPRQGGALDPRRELHRVLLVEGLRQGRDHHLGDPADRLPLGRAGLARSTSPAAAPAARPSPGTPTRRRGSATPTCAACCSRCSARPRPSTAVTRCRRGSTSSRTPSGPRPTSPPAARAAWSAPPGTRPAEIVAAAHVHTIKKYGPDRVAGFSPIPAMSMVSHASGARFVNLIGGSMLSFYDWYADLPVASPQVFGDQTDVPESGDWWNAGYLIMWGSNLPVTRTPDAHWMTEARYRGQKVIAVAPDYADNVKFADEWLPARPGTDAALAMAMGHVVLKEFFVDRQTPYFTEYVKTYTDLPYLVRLEEAGDGEYTAGKFLTAADLADHASEENAAFKTVLVDARTGEPVVPNGSLGHRYGEAGVGKWNLDLGDVDPQLSLLDSAGESVVGPDAALRHARRRGRRPAARRAGAPRRRAPRHHGLRPAARAVRRRPRTGLPGEWPTGYDDADVAVHPGLAGADHRRPCRDRRPDRP